MVNSLRCAAKLRRMLYQLLRIRTDKILFYLNLVPTCLYLPEREDLSEI